MHHSGLQFCNVIYLTITTSVVSDAITFKQFRMKALLRMTVLMCVLAGSAIPLQAQMAVPPPVPAYQPLADDQLDQLLGPIALYPDPLIAQMLPASTFPTEIVLADRYSSGGGDPNQIDQQPWDASVKALARYPKVLKWMDDNLDWTTELGQAFLNQPDDVMNSIQRLRTSAYNLGNLQSTPQQQVINDDGYIEIVPVSTQVIYVPVYQPNVVYYQEASGPPVIVFNISYVIGWWLNCDFDWVHHHIIVWHRDHPRPPNWWHEPPRQRDVAHTTVWYPKNHPPIIAGYRGDRGWGTPNNQPAKQPVVTTVGRSTPEMPQKTPTPAMRSEAPAPRPPAVTPVNNVRPTPMVNRNQAQHESNGAFIGVQSARDTRTYSDRGRQSTQTINHPAPAQRPAAAPNSAPRSFGGGGGSHNSNSQQKH